MPTSRQQLIAACDSLEHWRRNRYVLYGCWSEGNSSEECDLCILFNRHWGRDDFVDPNCEDCPLTKTWSKCNLENSPWNKTEDGDKTEMITALEKAVAYQAAVVMFEELAGVVKEALK